MTPVTLLLLYIAFRLKHLVCDFFIQTDWMALTKGQPGRTGARALLSHALTHAVGTTLVVLVFAPGLWWLGPVDLLVHGGIDRVKGLLGGRYGWGYKDRWFWWSFGLDQEAHNFTHLAYIVIIVLAAGGIKA